MNLNHARKARAKDEAKAKAAANRARFGQTKDSRAVQRALAAKTAKVVDDAKREP